MIDRRARNRRHTVEIQPHELPPRPDFLSRALSHLSEAINDAAQVDIMIADKLRIMQMALERRRVKLAQKALA